MSHEHPPHPKLEDLDGGRWRRLLEEYSVGIGGCTPSVPAPCTLIVPAGYTYDQASVPRPLWSLLAPFELGPVAPLVHDFLYRHGGAPPAGAVRPWRRFSRLEADRLLLELARRCGVGAVRARLAYLAVRVAGWSAWRDPAR